MQCTLVKEVDTRTLTGNKSSVVLSADKAVVAEDIATSEGHQMP